MHFEYFCPIFFIVLYATSTAIQTTPRTPIKIKYKIFKGFAYVKSITVFASKIPKETPKAKALIKIIRECATNAIRHANATKLFVNISQDRIEIFDNGKFTNQTFIENTGIKGMRLNAETLGGELIISKDVGFKVVIKKQR